MCGICGILGRFASVADQEASIIAMTAPLQHRGPDGWGTYLAPEVAFGHTRLSIVDLASGHQPMTTDQSVISYNGEIYNHIELRESLRAQGVSFNTHCDTEVVLRLFETEGTSGFPKLNGQFAFLIWDRVDKTLLAVRDRYGMRPLYVLEWEGNFYFSSEMKSFDTIAGFTRRFSPERVLEHAALWNTLGDQTVYEDIRSVEAGTYEVFHLQRSPKKARYYEIGEMANQIDPPDTLECAKEQFTDLLQDAVDLRLRSDVPVGAYLSGGIDSSVIAYLTKKRKQDDFETFSVAFDDEAFDESTFQKEVSKDIVSTHVSVQISLESIEENFIEAVYHAERPIFRTAPIPLYLLSGRVRESDIKVVLTGEGADEILFGYDTFKELKILEKWKGDRASKETPQLIKQLYPHIKHYADPKRFGMLRMYYEDFLDDFDNELVGLNIRATNNKILSTYLNRDLDVTFDKERLLERLRGLLPEDFAKWSLLQKNSYLEIRTLLQGYLLSSQGDRMALGHGIEGRYPFLDHRVVEAVFHYPDQFKLDGFSQKHLLREAFRGKIPTSVLDRPKRPYTAPDLISFFRDGQLTEWARHFLSDDVVNDVGLFSTKHVNRFIRKFERRIPDEIGYRDNMIVTFILSAQIAAHWAKHPKKMTLDENLRRVEIVDY
jgi:asparagine synthase (glutamine-hydrolysing)